MSNKKDFNKKYDKMISDLQVKLVHMQDWVIENNKKVVIVFEGRDAAGKGGTTCASSGGSHKSLCSWKSRENKYDTGIYIYT